MSEDADKFKTLSAWHIVSVRVSTQLNLFKLLIQALIFICICDPCYKPRKRQ